MSEGSVLWTLEEISRLVSQSGSPAETLTNIVRLIRRRFETDVCSLYLLETDRTRLVLAATIGLRAESVGRIRMHISEGLVGLVAAGAEAAGLPGRDDAPPVQVLPGVRRGPLPFVPRRAGDRSRPSARRADRANARAARLQPRRSADADDGGRRSWRRSSARRARSARCSRPRTSGCPRSRRTCGGAGTTTRRACSASWIPRSGANAATTRSRCCRTSPSKSWKSASPRWRCTAASTTPIAGCRTI